jgi:hypothetical protein
MQCYQRILCVAGLTVGFIIAGIAWERLCMSPLVKQAQREPDPPDSATDDLPAECLAELSAMELASTGLNQHAPTRLAATSAAPGKSLPPETGNPSQPRNSANQATMQIHVSDGLPPALIDQNANARPIQRAQSAEWAEPAARSAADPWGGRRSSAAATLPASAEVTTPRNGPVDFLKSVDALDLMRRLRADDGDQRTEARRELTRRGFSEVDMELARQLFSPDAEARKQLAQTVPRLSSVDAAQWLMWLAQDPQPEVRLAAISTLATTGDPALLDRVEALARSDRDPQIQVQAEQIRKQRGMAAARGGGTETLGRAHSWP